MQRYKCTISYDGTGFSGYQVQPKKRTIQGEVEKALTKLHKGNIISVTASGRTDAGVHAKGQVIHFDSPLLIPDGKWEKALQAYLPEEIIVLKVERAAASFHARFDATEKEYRYFIRLSDVKDPFTRHFYYQYSYDLDLERVSKATSYLVGTHDYTSFCSAKTEVEDRVRTIKTIDVEANGEILMFRFVGNGFLYNMVRILVGTLLDVGRGVISSEEIPTILAQKDRKYAGKTAPAHGLYLWEVFYK